MRGDTELDTHIYTFRRRRRKKQRRSNKTKRRRRSWTREGGKWRRRGK